MAVSVARDRSSTANSWPGHDATLTTERTPDLGVDVGQLRLQNPILLASGTCGYGEEISRFTDLDAIGGIVVKGLSLRPEIGNAPPRIAETPGGMLNSIGLQNIGVEAFIEQKLPFLRDFETAVVANIWGTTVDEYVDVAARLDDAEGVAALELNVSCPNIKEGGINFGRNPQLTHQVTAAVRRVTTLPLWVKLSPGVTDVGAVARAAEEAGADALSVINTLRGMTVDVGRRRPTLSAIFGGLSGPALFPVALYNLYEVTLATTLPVLGIGGISSLDQVLQFMIIGSCAIQIGTANFYDPTLAGRLVGELRSWCKHEQMASIREVVGTLEVG